MINFTETPILCCHSFILQNYIASRDGYESTTSRNQLIDLSERTSKINKRTLNPTKMSTQINAWTLQGVLTPINYIHWTHSGCFNKLKSDTCDVSDALITSLCTRVNGNNRNRAFQLLTSGSMKCLSVQFMQ